MALREAVFGGGCFWCTEAGFGAVRGVTAVIPGYAGGHIPNPSYEAVTTGDTGHAEVVKVVYDDDRINYKDLLTIFFALHDPTTLNRQGNDVGTQYRSILLYTDETQKKEADAFIRDLNGDSGTGRVVTEVEPLTAFYPAEEYHRNYYAAHKNAPYCQLVISPKLEKLKKRYYELLAHGE